jgi:hypothetical protein
MKPRDIANLNWNDVKQVMESYDYPVAFLCVSAGNFFFDPRPSASSAANSSLRSEI